MKTLENCSPSEVRFVGSLVGIRVFSKPVPSTEYFKYSENCRWFECNPFYDEQVKRPALLILSYTPSPSDSNFTFEYSELWRFGLTLRQALQNAPFSIPSIIPETAIMMIEMAEVIRVRLVADLLSMQPLHAQNVIPYREVIENLHVFIKGIIDGIRTFRSHEMEASLAEEIADADDNAASVKADQDDLSSIKVTNSCKELDALYDKCLDIEKADLSDEDQVVKENDEISDIGDTAFEWRKVRFYFLLLRGSDLVMNNLQSGFAFGVPGNICHSAESIYRQIKKNNLDGILVSVGTDIEEVRHALAIMCIRVVNFWKNSPDLVKQYLDSGTLLEQSNPDLVAGDEVNPSSDSVDGVIDEYQIEMD